MSRHIVKSKPTPTTLIKIDCIDIDINDSFDKLIVCASKFEEALKKTGANTEDYTIIDLFNLALQATTIDKFDDLKRAIKGI